MEPMEITVVGAGTMGTGIAQVCLVAGYAVTLIDSDRAALASVSNTLVRQLAHTVERGHLTAAQAQAALSNLCTNTELAAARGAVVIEAISEVLDAKLAVMGTLDYLCPAPTVLASNTSSLSITRLGAATAHPERVIGMHFFNPVPVMKLVEVVRGAATAEGTVTRVISLAEQLGKTPVVVADRPGFVANRVLMPLINEAIFVLMEGTASAEAIDTVAMLGLNHPLGPLRLADLIGLDVCLAILEVLHHDLADEKYRPCPLLVELVASGHLGRKSGQGFYSYPLAHQET